MRNVLSFDVFAFGCHAQGFVRICVAYTLLGCKHKDLSGFVRICQDLSITDLSIKNTFFLRVSRFVYPVIIFRKKIIISGLFLVEIYMSVKKKRFILFSHKILYVKSPIIQKQNYVLSDLFLIFLIKICTVRKITV